MPVLALALLLTAQPPSAAAAIDDQLDQAIKLFNGFEDARATIVLKDVLGENPNPNQAALAHLYLGLLAFSALKPDAARAEFKQALRSDPSVDMPFDASAKARIAFDQARAELRDEIGKPPEPTTPVTPKIETPPVKPPPSVKPVVPPKLAVPPERPHHRDFVAAYVLGGSGLALLGGGLALGAVSNTTRASADRSTTVNARQGDTLANTAGTEGLLADIGFAAGGLAAAIGLTILILETTGGDGDTAVVQPTGRGFSLQF